MELLVVCVSKAVSYLCYSRDPRQDKDKELKREDSKREPGEIKSEIKPEVEKKMKTEALDKPLENMELVGGSHAKIEPENKD